MSILGGGGGGGGLKQSNILMADSVTDVNLCSPKCNVLYKVFIFSSNTSIIIIIIKNTYKATCFGPIGPSSGHTKRTSSVTSSTFWENVLEVNEPVLIIRPDDGPIGPKHVALYVILVIIIDVLD